MRSLGLLMHKYPFYPFKVKQWWCVVKIMSPRKLSNTRFVILTLTTKYNSSPGVICFALKQYNIICMIKTVCPTVRETVFTITKTRSFTLCILQILDINRADKELRPSNTRVVMV